MVVRRDIAAFYQITAFPSLGGFHRLPALFKGPSGRVPVIVYGLVHGFQLRPYLLCVLTSFHLTSLELHFEASASLYYSGKRVAAMLTRIYSWSALALAAIEPAVTCSTSNSLSVMDVSSASM